MAGTIAIAITCRYVICRNSAIRKAAAPIVGGAMMAPIPLAERMPPPISGVNPARRSIGQATAPSVTVVATPLPETVPSKKPDIVTVRPGPAPLEERPSADIVQVMKNWPAPECWSMAPKIVNNTM